MMQGKLQLLEQIKLIDYEELNCRLWVLKKSSRSGRNSYRALYAAIEGLDSDLKNSIKRFFLGDEVSTFPINSLSEYRVLSSELDEDQALFDEKENTDFSVIVDKIEKGSDNNPVLDVNEFHNAWALVFEFSNEEQKIYAFSKVKGGWNLRPARSFKNWVFNEGQFEKVEAEKIFLFRDSIDFVAVGSDVFIRDKENYELGLNIREGLERKRDLLADAFSANGIIASVDELKLAIGTDKRLLRRLVAVEENRYYEDQVFIEQMKQVISEYSFDLSEDENGQFLIDENNVDLFLKLVNDKRFLSLIKREMVDADVVEPVRHISQ